MHLNALTNTAGYNPGLVGPSAADGDQLVSSHGPQIPGFLRRMQKSGLPSAGGRQPLEGHFQRAHQQLRFQGLHVSGKTIIDRLNHCRVH